MSTITDVDIFVDPACPWAWLTWNWLREAEAVRGLHVRTHLFCLAEINRGKEEGRIREAHDAATRALRALVQARREGGDGALAALYAAIGDAHHERGEPLGDAAILERSARDAGLDPTLPARALADDGTYAELITEHRAAAAAGVFGVPSLSIGGGTATFGPVVDRRVTGEEAGELWDHTAWLLHHPVFYELKRERTSRADVGRYRLAATRT